MAHTTAFPCLAALAAAFLIAPAEQPRFAPKAGLELTRAYKGTQHLESGPMRMYMNDEEVPTEGHPQMRLQVDDEESLEVVDVIEAAADGRATKLVRTFQSIEAGGKETMTLTPPEGEEQVRENEKKRASALEGKKVRFTWKPDEEEYAIAYVDDKGDEDLLDGLRVDADFTGFLPKKEVEEGTEWSVEAKVIGRLDSPCGRLHLVEEGEEEDKTSEEMNDQLDSNITGEAKATWKGVREVDGRKLGVIAIESDVETHGEVEKDSQTRSVKLHMEYSGEVLWDLEGGHLASLEIGGPVEVEYSVSRDLEGPNGTVSVRQEFSLKGEGKHELTVTR